MRVMATTVTNFTAKEAKVVLNEILAELTVPENVQKIAKAKENSGNEMLNMMQFVFPVIIQIQMDVIKNWGFEGREGVFQFAKILRNLEREDSEIAQLNGQLRSYFLPPDPRSQLAEASL